MQNIGGETSWNLFVEARQAEFTGVESGGKFPKTS